MLHDPGLTWRRTYTTGCQRMHWAVVRHLGFFTGGLLGETGRFAFTCIRRAVRYH